ncbi:hypothetical protein [Streptomyces sp. CNQ085]|uniref:hypothetical protein n=1 Tax=Streptomyces sp. CNQ085 TaxID=2886944 RepID=UPI0035B2E505
MSAGAVPGGTPGGVSPQSARRPGTAGARRGARPGRRPGGVGRPGRRTGTLAFVESPVQLLNVLEWAHTRVHTARGEGEVSGGLTVVVLPPREAMARGQLRRMAELARDEGITVRWEEARGGAGAPLRTIASLLGPLRRAAQIVVGDPFSRYVQLLLSLARTEGAAPGPGGPGGVVVVDDGTATMEFVTQLARGERLVRWHRRGAGGARAALFAPVSASARRRMTPSARRRVEVFSSMPVEAPEHVSVIRNDFAWTRARFGPPALTGGTDLVGTSLVETGVVDPERYLEAVASLTRAHGATRYFAHRRESPEKLHRIASGTGLEIVRPDLPLELVARRGPVGRTIVSFPSTVVHTLPLALAGTGVTVAVCDVDPAWLTEGASPRARGFLSGVTGTARGARRLPSAPPAP